MTERILQVTAPHFCAGAIWTLRDGSWVCTEAAPILRWMVGMDAATMKERKPTMTRKGWKFDWITNDPR